MIFIHVYSCKSVVVSGILLGAASTPRGSARGEIKFVLCAAEAKNSELRGANKCACAPFTLYMYACVVMH